MRSESLTRRMGPNSCSPTWDGMPLITTGWTHLQLAARGEKEQHTPLACREDFCLHRRREELAEGASRSVSTDGDESIEPARRLRCSNQVTASLSPRFVAVSSRSAPWAVYPTALDPRLKVCADSQNYCCSRNSVPVDSTAYLASFLKSGKNHIIRSFLCVCSGPLYECTKLA
jgi:hypothetical protein